MPPILPHVTSRQDYARVYTDMDTWLPAVRVLCDRHGMDAAGLHRQTFGTHVVFRTGARIVKLFCPFWEDDFSAERAALRHIHGVPAPEIVAEGDLEGWPARWNTYPVRRVMAWDTMSCPSKQTALNG